jgi:hypothetical protein
MAEYCQSGKQKKAYKTTVVYFTPGLEKGLSLDKANEINKGLSERKNAVLKELFYLIGNSSTFGQSKTGLKYYQLNGNEPNWFSLISDDESEVLENIKDDNSSTKFLLFTLIVKIENKNKIFVYQTNQESRRMKYSKSYSTDLNNLMADYTLLAPKEVIEEITQTEFNSRFSYTSIILNENGEIDLSKAVENRERLWEAYIKKYTAVKESADDNSNKSTAELSLDLSSFCRYGRKISDLQSL